LNLNEEDTGNRKFILIEQMDYVQTITSPRIQEVLKRSESKDTFIYAELAEWNEQAKKEINAAKDLPELVKLLDTLYEKYFLNYNVRIKDFKEKIVKEDNFKKLALDEQKRMFLTMLDLNQMYVQESEMADKRFGISKEDQKLTKEFYKN
jgi:adenine-specific DNA-methyltransferase